ncbi:hypothetical protein [Maricaulis sp.]|uniref:bifunctional folylpolyglutamate synthase/dihydrofolate synthase n=1 Tax=Maricaulis sp. TaxID=1486257 RepID=UPI000C3CA976|nr:hypothetical protein [Maricaulis sp.]MAC89635.1 hypothetical protein [Maricaulis sp.]
MRTSTLDLPRFGDGVGLARTAAIAARLGLDLPAIGRRSVVIAGSNGKGSVARMLGGLFQAAGERTGLFTSPHLQAFNERFELAGEMIADNRLQALEAQIGAAVSDHLADHPGDQACAFEAGFLTALLWFEQAGAERLVIEAGIGGRYDPTRLLQAPVVALVSLDREHMPLLGHTLREVALDKLDVAPPGARVVIGRSFEGERPALAVMAGLKPVRPLWVADQYGLSGSEDRLAGHHITIRHRERGPLRVLTPMHGRFQADNLEVALEVLAEARPDLFANNWPGSVAEALTHCTNPARMEVLPLGADDGDGEPGLIIDAGHSPAGIAAAVSGVASLLDGRPARLLLAMSADKSVDAMLDRLAPAFDDVVVSALPGGVPAALLEAAYRQRNPRARLQLAPTAAQAIAAAQLPQDGRVLVGLGGLFWAAALRDAWLMACTGA